jgi:hypothetical protein
VWIPFPRQQGLLIYFCSMTLISWYVYRGQEEIQTKVLGVFLLAIHSHLYSFALRFLILRTHTSSYSFYSPVTVHCKGERRKTIPPSLWFKKSIQKPENSQDYALKPQRNCTIMISASVLTVCIFHRDVGPSLHVQK